MEPAFGEQHLTLMKDTLSPKR